MTTKQRGPKATAKRDDPAQSRAFIEKAREIDADQDRSAADKIMGEMAKLKPAPKKGESDGKGRRQ